jgi:hypothetical protein
MAKVVIEVGDELLRILKEFTHEDDDCKAVLRYLVTGLYELGVFVKEGEDVKCSYDGEYNWSFEMSDRGLWKSSV